MKLMCNLNSKTFLNDYKEIGLSGLVVGNDEISSRHCISLSLEEMVELSKTFEVYVLMNLLYSEQQLPVAKEWLLKIKDTTIQGIVFQDLGLFNMAKSLNLCQKLMYHPETLNTNHLTLNDLHEIGIDSAFLAREISKEDITQILDNTTMPIALQIHGVQYMGQSRRLLLSNYNKAFKDHTYVIKVKDSDIEAYIYEDEHGCNVQTREEMCVLELLNHFQKAEWFYIETKFMDDYRALEMVNLYQDAVNSLNKGTFLKDVHALRPLMTRLMDGKMNTGFMEDGTVYRLADVREKDNEKRN